MEEKRRATEAAPTVDDAKVQINPETNKDSEDNLQQGINNLINEYNKLPTADEQSDESGQNEFISASDLLAMPNTKMPTLYEPILPMVGVCVVGGESDAGKSMLLRNLAICVATGREFLGFPFGGKHKSAIYAASEDDCNATSYMMKKHNLYYRDNREEWSRLHFIFDGDDILNKLEMRLSEYPADLIVVDSFADFFNGKDMNNSAQIRAFVKPFNSLARRYQCCVVFLHHVGKWQENNTPSKNALNGSQSLEAIARACFLLVRDRMVQDNRHLCIVKHNYLGSNYKSQSIELKINTDSFTFLPTGNRVPLDQLAGSSPGYQKKSVEDYGSDDDFAKFFAEIKEGGISKTGLTMAIKDKFKCSQEKAYDIINTYTSKGWLSNVSERKDRIVYEYSKPF